MARSQRASGATFLSTIPAVASFSCLTALLTPMAAHAQVVTFTFMGASADGSQRVAISGDGGAHFGNSYVGLYVGSFSGQNVNLFCVDKEHDVDYLQDVTAKETAVTQPAGPLNGSYYDGGLASALNSTDYHSQNLLTGLTASERAGAIAYLTDTYMDVNTGFFSGVSGSTSYRDNMSAIGISIWDIAQDGADGIGAGSLVGDSTTQAQFGSLVTYYENQARQNLGYTSPTAIWLQTTRDSLGNHAQDFVLHSASVTTVPEPGVVVTGLSLAGMTGLGMLRGRFRRRTPTKG